MTRQERVARIFAIVEESSVHKDWSPFKRSFWLFHQLNELYGLKVKIHDLGLTDMLDELYQEAMTEDLSASVRIFLFKILPLMIVHFSLVTPQMRLVNAKLWVNHPLFWLDYFALVKFTFAKVSEL